MTKRIIYAKLNVMEKIKTAAYARVSTLLKQDTTLQLEPIRQFAENRSFEIIEEFTDKCSGSKDSRPALDRLIRDAQKGKFKVLICFAIDRLGRSTKHLLSLIDELNHYGVKCVFLREDLDLTTPHGKLLFSFIASIAEFERSLISERIKNALAVKKAIAAKTGSNWRCGRPPISDEIKEQIIELYKQKLSIRKIAQHISTISKSTVERVIKEYKTSKQMEN